MFRPVVLRFSLWLVLLAAWLFPAGMSDARAAAVARKPRASVGELPARRLVIDSPDHAQTYAGGVTIRYVLFWDQRRQELDALITFSNSPFVDFQTPRREETFRFRLPGVSLNAASGVFSAQDAAGRLVPVAVRRPGFPVGSIEPTAGTVIYVRKPNGRVQVQLTTDHAAPAVTDHGQHWVIEGQVGLL